ncbi:S8 family serine peptidase [Algicola sagamiensis]|uniref:S8 family serine peptidase n=1 Tax=Algicola sagamiensis TaxID=163869 RepID=UPI00036BB37F|nr:S8 family serine peptidase [Algicola sagamiensis]
MNTRFTPLYYALSLASLFASSEAIAKTGLNVIPVTSLISRYAQENTHYMVTFRFNDVATGYEEARNILFNQLIELDPNAKEIHQIAHSKALIIETTSNAAKEIGKLTFVNNVFILSQKRASRVQSSAYIKATDLRTNISLSGIDVDIAIIDTGVDYSHVHFNGAGTVAAYDAFKADLNDEVSFPQGDVIDGHDFVGKDGDPLDTDGHGTHVASIAIGISPNSKIYAYQVLGEPGESDGSEVIAALSRTLDPDENPSTTDIIEVANLSLTTTIGRTTGTDSDNVIKSIVEKGVGVIAGAGNEGNLPFSVGDPSTAIDALSVASVTQSGDKRDYVSDFKVSGDSQSSSIFYFNENVMAVKGADNTYSIDQNIPLVLPPSTNKTGCTAFNSGIDFTGNAVLLTRSTDENCKVLDQVLAAQDSEAEFVIIKNQGDKAFPEFYGNNTSINIFSIGVSESLGDSIELQVEGGSPPDYQIEIKQYDTVGGISRFSSRGPSISNAYLKPEISAPGEGIFAAKFGTGFEEVHQEGTSVATPVVSGGFALLREAFPTRTVRELKALIMNTAELEIYTEPKSKDPFAELAPISWVGSGVMNVEKAHASPVAAWDKETGQASLSFGYIPSSKNQTMKKTVEVKNFTGSDKTYLLKNTPRFDNDKDMFTLTLPNQVIVPANSATTFEVTFALIADKLQPWSIEQSDMFVDLDLGAVEPSAAMTRSEIDGAIVFEESGAPNVEALHIVYHALPQQISEWYVTSKENQINIKNTGVGEGKVMPVSLVATDPVDTGFPIDIIGGSFEVVKDERCSTKYAFKTSVVVNQPLFRADDDIVGSISVEIDTDNDKKADFVAVTASAAALKTLSPDLSVLKDDTTRAFARVYDDYFLSILATSPADDSTAPKVIQAEKFEHILTSDYVTLQHCLEGLGLQESDFGKEIGLTFEADPTDVSKVDKMEATVKLGLATTSFSTTGNFPVTLKKDESADMTATGPSTSVALLHQSPGVTKIFEYKAPQVQPPATNTSSSGGSSSLISLIGLIVYLLSLRLNILRRTLLN